MLDASEIPMRFLTLDFKMNDITSESTFMRCICGTVVHEMLKSKVEKDFAFFSNIDFV